MSLEAISKPPVLLLPMLLVKRPRAWPAQWFWRVRTGATPTISGRISRGAINWTEAEPEK